MEGMSPTEARTLLHSAVRTKLGGVRGDEMTRAGSRQRIDAMPNTFRNNKSKNRFELEIDDHLAFVDYEMSPGSIALVHTEVPKELGGRGVGSILAKAVLENVRAQGMKVEPRCEFLAGYIKKHPEFADLVN
jgi:predicted GNAT family acetyltransferase